MKNDLIIDITIFEKARKAYKAFEYFCFTETTSNRLLSFIMLTFFKLKLHNEPCSGVGLAFPHQFFRLLTYAFLNLLESRYNR